jgi:hypothetical protein
MREADAHPHGQAIEAASDGGTRMHFFLTEIAARLLGLYLCVNYSETIWRALGERKIKYMSRSVSGWVDWMIEAVLAQPTPVAHRDTSPTMYWVQIVFHVMAALCCLVMAIFGWTEAGT